MKNRICMAIITATPSGSIVKRETKDQLEKSKKRAQFEKNRKRLKVAIIGNKPISTSLLSFNNGIANAIAEFKQSKNKGEQITNSCQLKNQYYGLL